MWKALVALVCLVCVGGVTRVVWAHSGGLQYDESDRACHACKADCAKWKLEDNELHVHYRAGVYKGIDFATYRNKGGQLLRVQGGQGVLVENDPREGSFDPMCEQEDEGEQEKKQEQETIEPSPVPSPTPQVAVASVVAAFSDIIISEVLPISAGEEDSFIELHNVGDETVNLSKFRLSSEGGTEHSFSIPENTTIDSNEYLVFFGKDTGISFDDSEEGVVFQAPNKSVIVKLMFDVVPDKGIALMWDGVGNASWTGMPTPGKINQLMPLTGGTVAYASDETYYNPKIVEVSTFGYNGDPRIGYGYSTSRLHEEEPSSETDVQLPTQISLHDIHSVDIGSQIQTTGTVSAVPGMLGEEIMYLAGSGIGVVLPEEGVMPMKIGDTVLVTGIVGEIRGRRLLVVQQRDDIERVAEGPPPLPHEFDIKDITKEQDNFLVHLSGVVRDYSDKGFILENGMNTIIFSLVQDDAWPELVDGDRISVTGIVVVKDEDVYVFPRNQHDIMIEQNTAEEDTFYIGRLRRGFGIALMASGGILYTLTRPGRPNPKYRRLKAQ